MKIRQIFYIVSAVICIFLCGCSQTEKQEAVLEEPASYDSLMKRWKGQASSDTMNFWYTSDADKDWLEAAAQEFEKEYSVKVNLVYYDGVSFFNDINQANQSGEGPDGYLMGNDQLELAKNSGMAEENTYFDDDFWQQYYPEVAKKAVTYQGKQYGYPIYFDTYCLVYDANLLENAPASIDDILAFLDEYEDTGSTKAIFRWDVADPYINTMFIASYAALFGDDGDDASAFSVNNDQCIAAMEYFQSLSAYLWMNKNNISHDTVMNRIKDGTLVLGLCKSDILPVLYELNSTAAGDTGSEGTEGVEGEDTGESEGDTPEGEDTEGSEGNTPEGEAGTEQGNLEDDTNYQISYVPSLTAEMSSTTLSTTYAAFVNPYGKDAALGNMFALYLSYGYADKQYAGNGKLPVINQKDAFDNMQAVMYAQYLNSKPVPKVIVFGDYLSESGIAFDAIWGGKDAKEQLDWLQEIMEQKIK